MGMKLESVAANLYQMSLLLAVNLEEIWEKHTDEKIKEAFTLREIEEYIEKHKETL